MRFLLVSMGLILSAASASAGWDEGLALLEAGKVAEARVEFQALTNTQPSYAGGWYMVAICDQRLGEPALAQASLVEAIALDSKQMSWRLMLAETESQTGDQKASLITLEGIDAEQLDVRGQRRFVDVLASLTRHQRVLELAEPLMTSTDAGTLARLGELFIGHGKPGRGLDALERSFGLEPDARVGRRMISVATTTGEPRRAAELATKLASALADPEHDLLEGEQWLEAGETKRAMAAFDRPSLSGRPEVALYRAQALREGSAWKASEQLLRAALATGPETSIKTRLLRELGFVLFQQGRLDESLLAYERAGDEESVATVKAAKIAIDHNLDVDQEIARYTELTRLRKEYDDLTKEDD